MDDYEAMISRAQERREALKLRLKETMTALPTKRHVETAEELENVNPQTPTSNEDSPTKRSCKEFDTLIPHSASSNNLPETISIGSPCRTKLAALARDISSWEDDSSSPTNKITESPAKVWKPPSERSELFPAVGAESIQPIRCGRAGKDSNKTALFSVTGYSKTNHAPEVLKPTSLQSKKAAQSSNNAGARATTAGTDGTGSYKKNLSSVNGKEQIIPKSNVPMASSMVNFSKSTSAPLGVPSFENTDDGRLTIESAQQSNNRRLSDANEPTRMPISARMAAWKKMTSIADEESKCNTQRPSTVKSLHAASESKVTTQSGSTQCSASSAQPLESKDFAKHTVSVFSSKSKINVNAAGIPKAYHENSKIGSELPPLEVYGAKLEKMQRKVEAAAPVVNSSPKKLGQAMVGIQDKLNAMCENWKRNEIASKSRRERTAELELIENRWKNGILVEDSTQTSNIAATRDMIQRQDPDDLGGINIPPPPPAPCEWSRAKPMQQKACSQKQSAAQSQPATANADNKKKTDVLSTQVASILETNLIAMGFEKSSSGTVATLPRTMESPSVIKRLHKTGSAADLYERPPPEMKVPLNSNRNFPVLKAHTENRNVPVLNAHTENRKVPVLNAHTENRAMPTTTQSERSGGLYRMVKEQVQAMKNPSNSIGEQKSVDGGRSVHDRASGMKHMPSVFFCESKNTVLVASSAEDSFCSVDDNLRPTTTANEDESLSDDEHAVFERPDYEEYESDAGDDDDSDDDDEDDDVDVDNVTMKCSSSDKPLNQRGCRKVDRHSSYRHCKPLHWEASGSDTSSSEPDERCEVSTTTDNDPMRDYDNERTQATDHSSSRQRKPDSSKRFPRSALCSQKPSAPMLDELPIEESSDLETMHYRSAKLPKQRLDHSSDQQIQDKQHLNYENDLRSDMNNPKNIPPTRAGGISCEKLASNPRCQPTVIVSKKAISSQIQGLKEMAAEEEQVLLQASNALSHCIKSATHGSTSSFVGSAEAVECHRLLLISMKKRESFLTELKRLREGQGTPASVSDSLGALTMSNIRVPIKPEFMAKIGTIHDTSVHHFFVLLRNGVNVVASRRFCTQETMILGRLDVPGEITLNCLPCDFTPSVYLEVYAMAVSRDRTLSLTPKKTYKANRKAKDAEQSGIRGSSFVLVAQLQLDVHSLSKTHFPLNGVTYSCPLKGTILAKLTLQPETNTFIRGYLNSYSDESGDGWNRYWCVLYNDRVSMWRHQTAELYKDPIGHIDLCQCVTERAVAGCFGSSTSPTCLELVTIKNAAGKQVKHHSENISTLRHWLIADSVQECSIWCSRLNRVLEDLREWHPYAVPSLRMPSANRMDRPR